MHLRNTKVDITPETPNVGRKRSSPRLLLSLPSYVLVPSQVESLRRRSNTVSDDDKRELLWSILVKVAFLFVALTTSSISYAIITAHANSNRLAIIESSRFSSSDALVVFNHLTEVRTNLQGLTKKVDSLEKRILRRDG